MGDISMAFQSYCLNLGTTSFRVQNLNYKIERQLQMLNELWSNKENKIWDYFSQERYYNIMHKEGFVTGDAQRKDKDARQKTSGLVEIGVIDKERRITEIGYKIIEIIQDGVFEDDNIFNAESCNGYEGKTFYSTNIFAEQSRIFN